MPCDAPALPGSIGAVVELATCLLADAGGSPARDARRIVADLLAIPVARLGLERERVLDPSDLTRILAAVSRRRAGEPVEYVTGVAGFRQLELRADRRGLIPRPETEGLVDRALALDQTGVVVDVGTGTGCLALALRAEGGYGRVIAVDSSSAALGLARENRDRLGLAIELVRSDLTSALATASVDLLVSNPPYVSAEEYAVLDPSVRDYEPRAALETGAGGLLATERLLADGARAVRPGGAAVIEIAASRAAASAALARRWGWRDVRVDEDLFGRPRYLVACREES